eukprot:1480820-Rhodomonas_salina.1
MASFCGVAGHVHFGHVRPRSLGKFCSETAQKNNKLGKPTRDFDVVAKVWVHAQLSGTGACLLGSVRMQVLAEMGIPGSSLSRNPRLHP